MNSWAAGMAKVSLGPGLCFERRNRWQKGPHHRRQRLNVEQRIDERNRNQRSLQTE
jgi:hypothetical protein